MELLNDRMSRRGMLRGAAFGAVGVGALALVGCGDDDGEMMEPTSAASPTGAMTQALVSGWYREKPVRYYDFGMRSAVSGSTVIPAPIWAFITGMDDAGNPVFVEGQHNVVDVAPGDAGYSDLWEVRLVMAPADYKADSIRSKAEVEASGYEVAPAGLFVNCPIVDEGTTLEGGEPLVQGWYKGKEVYYPDFGPNPPAAIPIWAFITGMDTAGNPQFVEGQHNVIDSVPDDAGYSAFWRVNLVTVATGYVANSIQSAAAVGASGFSVEQTGLVVNCPVVEF